MRSVRDRPRHCEHPRSASRRSGERFIIAPTCRSTLPPSVTIGDCCTLPPLLDIAARCCSIRLFLASPISRSAGARSSASFLFFHRFCIYEKFFFNDRASLPPFFLFLLPLSVSQRGKRYYCILIRTFVRFTSTFMLTCKRHLSSFYVFAFCRSESFIMSQNA